MTTQEKVQSLRQRAIDAEARGDKEEALAALREIIDIEGRFQ